jgi:hypothetical protein
MVRSAIQRLAPYLAGRIRENQRLLSSVSSSSVLHEDPPSSSYSSPSPSPSPSLDALQLTENCVRVLALSLALFHFLCYFARFDLVLFSFIEDFFFFFQFSVLLYWVFQFCIFVGLLCFMVIEWLTKTEEKEMKFPETLEFLVRNRMRIFSVYRETNETQKTCSIESSKMKFLLC